MYSQWIEDFNTEWTAADRTVSVEHIYRVTTCQSTYSHTLSIGPDSYNIPMCTYKNDYGPLFYASRGILSRAAEITCCCKISPVMWNFVKFHKTTCDLFDR